MAGTCAPARGFTSAFAGGQKLKPRTELALAGAVVLATAVMCLYRLDASSTGVISDVATDGLDARNILAGHLSLFFPANNGREAFPMYYLALFVAAAGSSPFVMSFSTVLLGPLTAALTFRLWSSMFGSFVGLLASAFLAASSWLLVVARTGYPAACVPPFVAATMYLTWKVLRRGRRRHAVLGGVALGGAMYTYLGAAPLPPLVALVCLAHWRLSRGHWRQLALMAGVALLVFAPELVYFILRPHDLFQRVDEVNVFNPQGYVEGRHNTLLQGIVRTAGMFFLAGDADPRHNVPGYPIFWPGLALLFVAGLIVCLWLARRDARYAWPLLWLVAFSVPSAVTHESPSMLRVVGLGPGVMVIPALAVAWLPGLLRVAPEVRPRIAAAFGATAAAASIAVALSLLGPWTRDPDTDAAFRGPAQRLAMLVESLPDSRFAFSLHDRWPIEFVAPVTQQAPWFEEDVAAVPIPGPTERDVVIAAVPAAPLARLDPAWLPGLQALPSSANAAGQPDYAAFRWPAADVARFMSQMTPLNATFGADYQLAGTSLERVQGQTVLNLLWRPLQPSGPYDLYVHLLDAAGKQVAQADLLARSPSAGSGDYVLLTQHPLAAPPGSYVALAGVAHRSTAHPEQVVGGAIGTEVRIPVEI